MHEDPFALLYIVGVRWEVVREKPIPNMLSRLVVLPIVRQTRNCDANWILSSLDVDCLRARLIDMVDRRGVHERST